MRIALAKKYSSFVMKAQSTTSLYHSVTHKRKMLFSLPLQRKIPGKIVATFDYSLIRAWTAVNHGVYYLPKCNNENLEQSLQEVRTSGRQRSSTIKEDSLGKETTCFIFFSSHFQTPAPTTRNLLKGNMILFPAIYPCQLSYSTF